MKITQTLIVSIGMVNLFLSSSVMAEAKPLQFPPANNNVIHEYPPVANMQNIPMPNFQQPQPIMPLSPQPLPLPNNQGFNMPNMNFPMNMPNVNSGSFPFMNNNNFGGFPNFTNGFNNNGNGFNPFSGNNMPFGNNSGNAFGMPNNPMNTMFGNNTNRSMPFFGNTNNKKRKKAWGDKRNIWPDFYTDFTDEAWDTMSSGPRDLGRMPGGWRFPHISSPDPVTVSDAIVNQFPPIAEEAGNMMDISDWGIFDNK